MCYSVLAKVLACNSDHFGEILIVREKYAFQKKLLICYFFNKKKEKKLNFIRFYELFWFV